MELETEYPKLEYHYLNQRLNRALGNSVFVARVLVGKRSGIPEGEFTNVTVGGKQILVANIQGRYFATSNICTHEGAKLHEGEIHNKELTCPRHGAKWDLTTGHLTWFREYLEPLGSYTVVIEDDVLFVEI